MGKLRWTDLIRQPERRAEVLREARPAKGWSVGMSAWGHNRKSVTATRMSAFGGKAEVDFGRLEFRV